MNTALIALTDDELEATSGGMDMSNAPLSDMIEDRRTGGWTEAQGIQTPGDFARWDREFGPPSGAAESCYELGPFRVCF